MKLTNNEAENLINYYFEKMVIGFVAMLALAGAAGLCLYKIGQFLLA